jgi:hypothetical protein
MKQYSCMVLVVDIHQLPKLEVGTLWLCVHLN